MKVSIKLVAAIFFLFFALNDAMATSEIEQTNPDLFYPDFSEDETIKIEKGVWQPFTLSYGGWITPSLMDDRNNEKVLTASSTSLRLWVHSTLWENAFVYLRGRNMFMGVIQKENYPDVDSTQNIIDLDMGYISMSFADRTLELQAGRKYFLLGTGLVFNGRGDGAELRFISNTADVKLFGLYTGLMAADVNPYGLSSRDFSDGAKRIFSGAGIEKNLVNQTVYLLAMVQIDFAEETAGIKSSYNSQYYGAGLKGLLFDGLDYYAEFVYQLGTNSLYGKETDVSAYGGMLGLNYYVDAPSKPAATFQYAYGSGDNSLSDSSDSSFNYFGTYVGGFALRPKLQNLHVFRFGLSVMPLYSAVSPRLNRMTLLGRYAYYMKDISTADAGGGIGAVNDNTSVGHGIDLSLRWKIYHDLAFFSNFGYFISGAAFSSSESNRSFVMAGVNLSF